MRCAAVLLLLVAVLCAAVSAGAHAHAGSSSSAAAASALLKKAEAALRANGNVFAGAAKLDGTLPLGTPLAGYNHGQRRVPYWPLPEIKEYTTFMTGSTGVINPTWVKAVVMQINGEWSAIVTIDGIGADGTLGELAYDLAADGGLSVPKSNIVFSASHTHSGPGAISPELLWALAPATDFLVPELQHQMASTMAKALLHAQANMAPAQIGIAVSQLTGVTRNRRAGYSPYVHPDSIDPNLAIVRLDDASGKPIATVWNYAMHGTCYGPDNMHFCSDIMGGACELIEQSVGGVALFLNADAGDIDPSDATCAGAPQFAGAPIISSAVAKARAAIKTSNVAQMRGASQYVAFGPTNMNITLERFNNCSSGGPLDICSLCEVLRCDLNAHLPDSWVENNPRFTALRFDIMGESSVLVTMPGEPLLELGWWVRNATKALGFDNTIMAGYSNSHMGYFATPNEYDIGGYESQLTFWGINTASMVLNGVQTTAKMVA